jgi:tetratricopeptide (TPR) repeat protein
MSRGRPWILSVGIPVLLLYGTLAVAQLRSARAMTEFKRLQKTYPPDSLQRAPAEVQHRKGEVLALAERMAPDNPEVAFQTALFHLVQAETESLQPEGRTESPAHGPDPRLMGSLNEGMKWIDRAIDLNPGYAEYPFVKATILQNLEGTSETPGSSDTRNRVTALLRLSHRLDPYRPALHYRLGSFWIALGEQEEARRALTIALIDIQRNARAVFDLLWSTVADVSELRTFIGEDAFARALLARFLRDHGFVEQARSEFEAVAAQPSLDYQTATIMFDLAVEEMRTVEARKILSKVNPRAGGVSALQRAHLKYLEGQSYFLENRIQDAINCYENAIRFDADTSYIHEALGNAYQRTGEYQRAIARYLLVLNRAGNLLDSKKVGNLHVELASAYEQNHQYKEAIEHYLKAAEVDPENLTAQKRASELSRQYL